MNAEARRTAETARAMRDKAQFPDDSLRRLLALYSQRGETLMVGLVKAELRTRERERMQAPLPYDVTLWG